MRKTYYKQTYCGDNLLSTRIWPLVLFFFFVCNGTPNALAANETQKIIKGIVKDPTGVPLAGVTVSTEDSNHHTTTDENGSFILDRVNVGDLLTLTSVGYKQIQVTVGSNDFIEVTME